MDSREQLMLNEHPTKLMLRFSIPAIIGMLMNAIYNIVDRIFVGQGVGSQGLTAITIGFPIMLIVLAFSMLIAIGACANISIFLGEGRKDKAEVYFSASIWLILIVSVILTVVLLLTLKPLLIAFGGENVIAESLDYYNIMVGFMIFNNIGFVLNSIMRGEGSPKHAMISMIVGAVANIILDYIFIYPLKMGIKGAAIATVISQILSLLWCIWFFLFGKSNLKFEVHKLSWNIVISIIKIGSAAFLIQLASSLVNLFFVTGAKKYGDLAPGISGDIAIAGIGLVNSISQLFFMPVFGINQGLQPIIGFNYGARQYKRVKQIFLRGVIFSTIIMTSGFLLAMRAPEVILRLFTSENDTVLLNYSIHAIRMMFFVFPFLGFQIVSANYFQSVGKPMLSSFLSLSRQVIFLIPLLIILPIYMGLDGVTTAPPIADFMATIITLIMVIREMKNLNKKHEQEIAI